MMTEDEKKKFQDWIFKCSAYQMALNLIEIDKETIAPPGGATYRDARFSYLSGELFSLQNDEEIASLVRRMKDDDSLDEAQRRAAYLYDKDITSLKVIPKDEYVAARKLTAESFNAWLKAKRSSDYSVFEPYLKKQIETRRKIYEYRKKAQPLYDQMLDDFEPGMSMEKYDQFFELLKERLIPLIDKIRQKKPFDLSFLKKEYPVSQQKAFMNEVLLPYLHFDSSWGYQNETEHPFTSWVCENDVRVTTKYLPDNVLSAIFSTVHEVGHATYEHDIDPAFDGMILSEGVSCGMHESQSRLCENYLGRTAAFWTPLYPRLRDYFPEQLGDVPFEVFMQGVNAAEPSLVRTEADELTYPMHIVIRYEIEKGLFNGSIATDGLDRTWNRLYKEYLGVEVPSDREGILQDMHWSGGEFGYFPTYALGSAIAAQIMHTMRQQIDVDRLLENSRYDEIMAWLKKNVHHYGALYDADEILRRSTGEPFNPSYYLDYLTDKYTKLYNL